MKKEASRMKKVLFKTIAVGEYHKTEAATTDWMKRLLPSRTAIAISMPSRSPPLLADKLANTSGAPLPNASSVTPASDSERRKVLEIY